MLWGVASGALELRQESDGGFRVRGAFPYATETELAPGRSERIEPGAFADRLEGGQDVHLLSSHDYAKPLASRHAGSLQITDTPAALEFEARIDGGTSWAQDFIAAHRAGLVRGLSPGFRVPAGGERIERRGSGVVRSITRAELFELSAVTRPAYPAAQVEARRWETSMRIETGERSPFHPLKRWRL
jgi:HK97 family phage prohead protease